MQGLLLNNDYKFQDDMSRAWVSSMGPWQLHELHVHEAGPVFNCRTSSAQCLLGLYFQPRPLFCALGLNTILYEHHSLLLQVDFVLLLMLSLTSCVMLGKTLTVSELQCQCEICKAMQKLVQVSSW